jgi:hypothetical protein
MRAFACIVLAIGLATLPVGLVAAHNDKRLDLDSWYSHLHRDGMASCCNRNDCHRTDAELRKDGHWWARLGHPEYTPLPKGAPDATNGSYYRTDWQLDGPWIEIPDDTIIKDDKGHPIPNPEGEAVICHPVTTTAIVNGGPQDGHFSNGKVNYFDWASMSKIYCFVPPAQY